MKKKYLTLLSLFFLVQPALADDTDIYGVSSIDVKPNVLIIFDNSGSMGTKDVPGEIYDPNKDYSYAGGKSHDAVYKYSTYYFPDINDSKWQCAAAKDSLKTKGYWRGKLKKNRNTGIVTCGGWKSKKYRLGNFANFDDQNLGEYQSRMVVAKQVIAQLIYDNYDAVRFGLMKFNSYNTNDESGYIVAECGAGKADLIGNYDPVSTVFTNSDQSADYGAVGGMRGQTWTPLSETMAEAGLYFAGAQSWFDGSSEGPGYPVGRFSSSCRSYDSGCQDYSNDTPIQYRCQKNYIILMTDGEPTHDNNKYSTHNYIINQKITEAANDGNTNYLDDVAYFLAHNDIRVIGNSPTADDILKMGQPGDFENQTITIYTIGFKQQLALLQNTATNGGGEYYTADNASTLNEALNSIITAIGENNEGFSAAAVPVSRANKAYAGNFVYYGLFQPENSGNWIGNLKKYAITNSGVIQDADAKDAVSGGAVIDNARSFWTTAADGSSVDEGGAGEKLVADIEAGLNRTIYTYTGTSTTLTDNSNKFITTNTTLVDGTYTGLTTDVIKAVRHEDGTWPLGSFLHSQPLVVHYDDDDDGVDDHSMIYAGANDGMLHCFDDDDGSEKWGFIPKDLLDNLSVLEAADSLAYFVDGTPVLYSYDHDSLENTPDKKMLIVGERRGGQNYTALDISDYNSPLLQYEVGPDILGSGNESLGQSWGKPQQCTMGYMDGTDYKTKDVFMMVGGYDDNQDSLTPLATDSKGRAVFAIDCQTGALFDNFNFNFDNFSSMTHSIIAATAFENPKSRTTTRVYAGDLNGNLFAFRDDIYHRNQDKTKKESFGGHYDGEENGVWDDTLKLFSSEGKKIFYPPNITNEYFGVSFTYPAEEVEGDKAVTRTERRIGDYVFYGTGDRANPERTDIENRFYAIKNNWQWSSNTPDIVEAYVDETDHGKIKAKDDNRVLVGQQRDENGDLVEAAGNGELFILDITDDLLQNKETDTDTQKLYKNYASDAIDHANNRGWFLRFVKEDGSLEGEKVVSSPIIFGGVIYFTTYIPADEAIDDSGDPCANPGAKGKGYLYAIGYRYGEAIMDLVPEEPGKHRQDRRKKLTIPGIPPEPVLVIHEDKPTIITGFNTDDPEFEQSMQRFYWRQINQ